LVLTGGARARKLARMMRFRWLPLVLALAAGAPARADAPPAPAAEAPAKTPAQQVDELNDRLAKATDPDEAAGIIAALQRLRLHSGSDTGDLLMARAIRAMDAKEFPLALSLLDTVVTLEPDWAEGWNKRATVRFYAGDPKGSMADIAQTLKRDPRHVGALAGMGMILEEAGLREDALRAYQRALAIAPHYQPVLDSVERLRKALEGRSL
jgi:tetratricopeptide (TPR) repeat protein